MFTYKQCIPLLAALCMAAPAFSQCDSTNHALFQIGLISPLGTNGLQAHKITNTVSINAIGGISGGVDAFEASGVFNVTNGTVKGFQTAGMFNIAQQVDHAVQAAGFANITRYQAHGMAVAGFLNTSAKGQTDVQVAGFANLSDSTLMQAAGFVNVAKQVEGTQVAGFSNNAKKIKGAQIAGFVNVAREVDGTQVAGFINIAHRVKGTQIGIINICDTMEGTPIGLINIVKKNGYRAVEVGGSESFHGYAALKLGVPKLYTVLAVGAQFINGRDQLGMGYGLGTQKMISNRLNSQTELVAYHVYDGLKWADQTRTLVQLKQTIGIHLARHLEVFAGPTLNIFVEDLAYENGSGTDFAPYTLWTNSGTRTRVQGWVGVSGGIRF